MFPSLVLISCLISFSFTRAGVIKPLTPDELQHIKQTMRDCQRNPATKIPVELIIEVKKGNWIDDSRLKEGLRCISTKTGFQNEAGTLQEDFILRKWSTHYSQENFHELKECIRQFDDPGTTAYELFKCRQRVLGVGKDTI